MTASKKQMDYINKWKRENVKRVSFELHLADYEKLKRASLAANESVNGYIKKAVFDRMKNDNLGD